MVHHFVMNETIRELKELKDEFSITNADIAIAVGVREQQVWRWFSGNSHNPQAAQETAIKKFVTETRAKLAEVEGEKIAAYEKVILSLIYDGEGGTFWARPEAGQRYSEASFPIGVIRKDTWYEKFREACGIYGNDNLLLTAFNNLCQAGKCKLLSIRIPSQRPLRHGEGFALLFEISEATRSQAGQDVEFTETRIYKDSPITATEMIPDAIRDPKAIILSIRERREAGAREMHGHYALRTDLHHEELEDESAQRISNRDLVEIIKGGKMSNDPQGSEYDTLLPGRIKTRKIIEIKRLNNSKAPMVFYQHDGSRLTIEPGESGVQTKLVHIKPLAVEKKK